MQQEKYSCETVQRYFTHIGSMLCQQTCNRAARFPWRIEVVESEDARLQRFTVRDRKWHHLVDGGGSKGQVAVNLPQQPLHPVTPPNIAYPAAHTSALLSTWCKLHKMWHASTPKTSVPRLTWYWEFSFSRFGTEGVVVFSIEPGLWFLSQTASQ